MITKIENALKYGKQHGGFGIEILYPGLIRPRLHDTGLSTIGRIDHARINPGTLIPMHPHRDDEILTYLRSGKVKHLDSEGHTDTISNNRLMMMNAGAKFSHEEKVLEEGGILTGLQIFLRPKTSGLPSQVQFHTLAEIHSTDRWRKIAGHDESYPLQIRSDTGIMDLRLEKGREISLPENLPDASTCLLYVFNGEVKINDATALKTGESLLIEGEHPKIYASKTTDIVIFVTHMNAQHYDGGMYSGNLQ